MKLSFKNESKVISRQKLRMLPANYNKATTEEWSSGWKKKSIPCGSTEMKEQEQNSKPKNIKHTAMSCGV